MSKCTYGRWAIINKEGHEFGNLGWFSNCDRADVLAYCKEQDIKIQEGEGIRVVEESEKFEGHLTKLRSVEKGFITEEEIDKLLKELADVEINQDSDMDFYKGVVYALFRTRQINFTKRVELEKKLELKYLQVK